MTIIEFPSHDEELFACPVGLALWEEYRRRNPDGITVPPVDLMDCKDPELMAFAYHFDNCEDCNEI